MLTYSIKSNEIKKKWLLIDVDGLVLGRVASYIANLLRGKHKATFTPHMDCGDNVIVINAKKVKLTGNKAKKKIYFKHTGYPGGIKEKMFSEIISGDTPTFILKKAVQRMMNSNALSKRQLSNLRVFEGNDHNLGAQKPEILDFASANRKNKV
jgi:large subunit ribosomal protein L13